MFACLHLVPLFGKVQLYLNLLVVEFVIKTARF